ncbi:MAG TPA: immunity 49 family protein [Kofleriaceae bacterium]|jgi:hypothetical protein
MKTISRPAIDRELLEERLDSEGAFLESALQEASTRAEVLSDLVSAAAAFAGYQAASGAKLSELCRILRLGAQAAAAMFSLAGGTGEVEIALGDRRARLPATGPTDATHIGNWRTGWWLATVVGDDDCRERLASTPISVLRGSSTRGDECQYLFIEALQRHEQGAPDWGDKLEAALDATDPAKTRLMAEDYVLNILVPEMQLVFQLAIGEVAPFNDALVFALERHKKYWSKPDRARDPDGFLALGAIAIAGLAHEAGMPIDCASDYAPRELIEGACRSSSS